MIVEQMFFQLESYSTCCKLISLVGDIPFNSESYKEMVHKNMDGNVDFSELI